MKEDDDIESKPFMSTAYNKFIDNVQEAEVEETASTVTQVSLDGC